MDKSKIIKKLTSNIPPFPRCVQKVLTMLRDPRIQLTKVGEVVSLDQGFAGRVLRMANSAYFGLPRRVYNVTEALVLLGYSNVRNVLISASASQILGNALKAYGMESGLLWEHSIGTAYSAQMISAKSNVQVHSMAFSCGLLHDVGKVAIDLVLSEEQKADMSHLVSQRGVIETELEVVGITHAEVGGEICRRWNLPEEIVDAVGYHHSPIQSERNREVAGIVSAANICAHLITSGVETIKGSDLNPSPEATCIPDDSTLEKLVKELPGLIASSKELLQMTPEPSLEHSDR
ncbi:MAG: HDOD domain-containing protein [bacterium]